MCTCKTFANAFSSPESAIWRLRFNRDFDWPFVTDTAEFASAYQLRKFVLKHFVEFNNPEDERLVIQLEVLRDMVLEAYNPPEKHLPPRLTSRNLAAFASQNSPWVRMFLSCPFFPSRSGRYGQRHPLFESIQLVLSHLLLSPASHMAYNVRSSRTNYDMAVVYNWSKPLSLLYRKLAEKESLAPAIPNGRRQRHSGRRRRPPRTSKPTHELDTHALLHIRNFWHRHLIETVKGLGSTDITENTYAKMARELMRREITPRPWERPLTEDSLLHLPTEWYGHYSTLASNWPRKRQELEEVQSLAEDWQEVDPMKLDFTISTDNNVDGFWSPIFSSIPAFQQTIPELSQCVFIRGLAPFVQLSPGNAARGSDPVSQATLTLPTAPRLSKYHPYLALRLRGVIHSIPAQPQPPSDDSDPDHSIPGFNRIIMILYKPTKRYLIQVLEHAQEEYGDSFTTALTTQMAQNSADSSTALDPAEIDARLDEYLRAKLLANPLWCDGSKLDKDAVEEMEEKFRLSEYLDWDFEFAYAYEGAVLPGQKILLGRWFRILAGGVEYSEGLEMLDGEAAGADQDAMGLDGAGSGPGQHDEAAEGNPAPETTRDASRHTKRERGPFIFWCR
ncbi:hypothetical protein CLAIMM_06589 [Cladophialophora immunda]|nr:hypothetical protein CLAIMM_06589 [Cladophialophora immunda]